MKKQKASLLIVDDNEELLIALKLFLSPHFEHIHTTENPNLILSLLKENAFDIILLDMNFNAGVNTGNGGIFWMNEILKQDPLATIVLITAYGDVELAVKAMKEGAADFIQKSWDEGKILSTVLNAYKLRQSKLEIKNLKQKQKHLTDKLEKPESTIIGKSPAMQKVFEMIKKVSKTDANVLILGENGAGKEVIAKEIHRQSARKNEIFVCVDMGALSETLFESELFGHKKGAFTDAKEERAGRFEIASGGTLFLDEIGNIPLHLQPKLLSAIQNREITPVGGNTPVKIDIKLISATNMDINKLAVENKFREDLLYRIKTIQIELPPLRERVEDISLLANHFLKIYAEKYCKYPLSITKDGMQKLTTYQWFGNVRELQHVIEKVVILAESNVLNAESFYFLDKEKTVPPENEIFSIAENEKRLIKQALEKFDRNLSLTAKKLGINRSTLYEKINKYGL